MDMIISHDFEEVNAAVFRNAQIYLRKKKESCKICIITPNNFQGLFKDADFFISIDNETLSDFGIERYADVLEYKEDVNFYTKLKHHIRNKIGVLVTPRQKKFYLKNGLEKFCLQRTRIKYNNFQYFRGNDNLDLVVGTKCSSSIQKLFTRQFGYLNKMILDNALYEAKEPTVLIHNDQILQSFLVYSGPKIVLRTRNFKNKATVHNTKLEVIFPLLKEMININKNLLILNIGYPILSLDLPEENYLEYNKTLSFVDELYLCSKANYSLMTAEAGLFTAFASSKINLIQYDEEWSMYALSDVKISLFKSRKNNSEIKDLDIRPLISESKYNEAASIVMNAI